MGQEVSCTARWAGKNVCGKALLENSEIIFGGEVRLKIPFSAIRGLTAVAGELRLKTDHGLVVFELGGRAEKWCQKIANPKSAVEKLGLKPGDPVSVLGRLDADFLKKLEERNSEITNGKVARDTRWIFWGVTTREDLRDLEKIACKMEGNAALWVIYAKGQKTLTEADVLIAGRKAGLKDVKVVAFHTTHTALKFVIPVEKR
jgi:hypothetical protein